MRKVRREVDSTFTEIRTYDDDGKLVEIRKEASRDVNIKKKASIPKSGGFGAD